MVVSHSAGGRIVSQPSGLRWTRRLPPTLPQRQMVAWRGVRVVVYFLFAGVLRCCFISACFAPLGAVDAAGFLLLSCFCSLDIA